MTPIRVLGFGLEGEEREEARSKMELATAAGTTTTITRPGSGGRPSDSLTGSIVYKDGQDLALMHLRSSNLASEQTVPSRQDLTSEQALSSRQDGPSRKHPSCEYRAVRCSAWERMID